MAEDKRELIVRALRRCIREKGYANTSLTDVALEAKMSPSHIRYYFDGKDAVLEHYFDAHCRQVVADVRAIPADDPVEWFRLYVDYYIGNPRIRAVSLGVIVEIFGLSVHHERLRAIKTAYDAEMVDVLVDFFRRVGVSRGTPEQAAQAAQALETGLKFNAVFADGYDVEASRAAFVAVVELFVGRPIGAASEGAARG